MDLSFSSLLSSLIISTLGLGFFMFGKRAERWPPLTIGLGMMVYPYFISSLAILWLLTGGLLLALYSLRHA